MRGRDHSTSWLIRQKFPPGDAAGSISANLTDLRGGRGAFGRGVVAHPRKQRWRNIRRLAFMFLLVICMTHCARPDRASPGSSAIDFRGDFETVDTRQYTAVECPHPTRQLKIITSPVRQGRYAARFEVAPGDNWSNDSIRCLVANYDSNESEGDDYYFAFSMNFPKHPSDNVVWELHSRRDIYSVDPNTSVAPHAITTAGGRLEYRLLTGPAFWNGSTWTGWSQYEPNIPLLAPIPVGQWIDVVVHIRFTHSSQGTLAVWSRTGGESWTREPQVRRDGIPTLQWIPGFENRIFGHRNDPRINSNIYTSSLYVELGLYPGTDSVETTDVVYLDGYRRGTSLAAVRAEFP